MSTQAIPATKPSRLEIVSAMIEEQGLTKEQLVGYLRQMMEIRALENNIANLLSKAVLKGASHLYAGEEAVAVGAVAALRDRRPDHQHASRPRARPCPRRQRMPRRPRPSRSTTTR